MAAGGMGRRRGPTLAERSAATRASGVRDADRADRADPADDAAGSGRPPDEPTAGRPSLGESDADAIRRGPRRRHCWVAGPGDGSGPWPGLVVEWHRDEEGWRARVVYLVGEPDSATTVETWVDAAHLRPA